MVGLIGLVGLIACTDDEATLSATALLVRASLDVRGVRPSVADLDLVAADPAAVDPLVDAYLRDPRFGDRVRSVLAPVWGTRSDESDTADADYSMVDEAGFLAAMGEEPLRLLGYIAANDLPYTELVTAEYTLANEVLAEWYPIAYPDAGSGWQKVPWTDHRPAAGVLSTNGLWWRYQTTTGNANRGRANAVTRILLCSDALERAVALDTSLDLTDEDAVRDALATNPGCVNCHVVLDPLGSYFWGFYVEFNTNPEDLTRYHPERERLWETHGAGPPSYYGVGEGSGLADLGGYIAADPRFPTCAVEQATEALLQRPMGVEDADVLAVHREAFLAGGVTLRALWRSILTSEEYRSPPGAASDTPWKTLSSDQYMSAVEDLTGFTFEADGHDAYGEDRYGLRSLAGGGRVAVSAGQTTTATPSMALVFQRVAEAGAAFAAAQDRASPGEARLFESGDYTATSPAEERVRALGRRVLSRDLDDDEVDTLRDIWGDVHGTDGGAEAAWAAVLATLLRHPDFVIY